MRHTSHVLPIVLTVCALAASAHAQQPAPKVQLNVPYSCQEGITRTVLRCEANPRFELCYWRDIRNGQPDEGYGRRDLMEDWMKNCKVATSAPRPAQPSAPSPAPTAQPPRPQPVAPATSAAPVRNDPGSLAVRRCLELGGSATDCMGQGFMTGLSDLAGLGPSALNLNPPGIRIGGTYSVEGGPSIAFSNGDARISSCGNLEPEARPYRVTKRGLQLQVEIFNQPTPLVVVLGADGRFTGPAAFNVAGRIITGYQTRTVEERRVRDDVVVSSREERVPVYADRTQRCAFASLRPIAAARAEVSVVGVLAELLGGQASAGTRPSGTTEAPAGPRMGGKYAGVGGLQLEFQTTSVVMDCGEAHVMRPYDVQNLADRVVVTVRNANVPLTLTLRPDGILAGSGTVEVAGRILTGVPDSGPTFSPITKSCAVGTLTVQ